MVKLDYQQMEVAIFAHFCQEPRMIEVIESGEDIHWEMAKEMGFPIPNDQPWNHEAKSNDEFVLYRRLSKSVIFGLLYGIGRRTLSLQIGKSVDEAQALMDSWFDRFPRTGRWMAETEDLIHTQGYVTTIMGRRRRLYPDEAYKAVNARIQGSCADIVKKALVRIHTDLWPDVRVKLIIHDEFACQVEIGREEELMAEIESRMIDFDTRPKLVVSKTIGKTYGDKD
jgi:DNA polymerase-1